MNNRICPICSYNDKSILYTQNFNNKSISLMDKYDVVSCNSCGFIFANNIPSQAEFDIYYKEMSKYEFNDKIGEAPESYNHHFIKIYNYINNSINSMSIDKDYFSVLDIGCSTGKLLSIFKQNGYNNLLGVDPSDYCIDVLKNNYKIDGIRNSIFDFETDRKFNVIILSAVLEHLIDINSFMIKLKDLLKDDGFIFIEVPDIDRFKDYIYAPFQQFSLEHVNYYSILSLQNLFNKYNLKLFKADNYINSITETYDPDIFALFYKSESCSKDFIKDFNGIKNVKKYIEESFLKEMNIKDKLNKILKNEKEIIIWGAGTHTQRLLEYIQEIVNVKYIVDSNTRYHNKELNDIIIKKPEDIQESYSILISTHSYQDKIKEQIENKLKLKNKIITLY